MINDIIMAVFQIIGVCAIGALARALRYLDEETIGRWSRVIIDFMFPFLIFHSIIKGFQPDRLGELWPLPLMGLVIIIVGVLIGLLLRKFTKSDDPDIRKTFLHYCAQNNYSFLPIVIIERLWHTEGLANLFFLNLGSILGYWTIGVTILAGGLRNNLKNILNPPLCALILAVVLCLTGTSKHVPDLFLRIANAVGAAAVPSILLLTGASMYPLPKFDQGRDLAFLVVLRLLVIPAVLLAILFFLPVSVDVRRIVAVLATMPVAMSSVVLTRRFGGSPQFAAQSAVITTLVAILTVPAWMYLMERLGTL